MHLATQLSTGAARFTVHAPAGDHLVELAIAEVPQAGNVHRFDEWRPGQTTVMMTVH